MDINYLLVILVVSINGQEELFTCEFLLLKLNIVNCMTDSTELGFDLSEKVSKLDEEDLKMKDMVTLGKEDSAGRVRPYVAGHGLPGGGESGAPK